MERAANQEGAGRKNVKTKYKYLVARLIRHNDEGMDDEMFEDVGGGLGGQTATCMPSTSTIRALSFLTEREYSVKQRSLAKM